jgi:hypothetical protein
MFNSKTSCTAKWKSQREKGKAKKGSSEKKKDGKRHLNRNGTVHEHSTISHEIFGISDVLDVTGLLSTIASLNNLPA